MRILVIDDDTTLVDLLCARLAASGHEPLGAGTGEIGVRRAASFRPDLVLLDMGLPDMDGRLVCRQLRAQSPAPILFLSVRGSEGDIVRGLDEGADDYLVKPFSLAELTARIAAICRRLQPGGQLLYDDGRLLIDLSRRQVCQGGHAIRLSPLETQLLRLLVARAGQAVPRDELISAVWGESRQHGYVYLATYIGQLRAKLGSEADGLRYIQTVRGVGYRFVPQPCATAQTAARKAGESGGRRPPS